MIKKLVNPIENIDEAMLNPGGDELDTHTENEDKVVHSIDEVVYEEHVNSVQKKLLDAIRRYYNSIDDEISLTEFYYSVTEEKIIVYDRNGIYLFGLEVEAFTMNEIDWILTNLPIFNDGMDNIDYSNTCVEFHPFRKDGWMVFRRSGSYNQLIGWVRKNLNKKYVEARYSFKNLFENGDFKNELNKWTIENSNTEGFLIKEENNYYLDCPGMIDDHGTDIRLTKDISLITNHTYYIGCLGRCLSKKDILSSVSVVFSGVEIQLFSDEDSTDSWQLFSKTYRADDDLEFMYLRLAGFSHMQADNFILVDLTDSFGYGNELLKEDFEAMIKRKYFEEMTYTEKVPVSSSDWYFDDRDDYCIVTEGEHTQINKFLGNYIETVDVTQIIVSPIDIKLQIDKTQELFIRVYPLSADDRTYSLEYNRDLIKIEDNIITALDEGISTIIITSNQNPEISVTVNIETYEYDKLLNDTYNIVRRDTDEFNKYKEHNIYEYIIGMKDHSTVQDLINTFKNRKDNIEVFDKDGNFVDGNRELTTGMVVKLKVNGKYKDELHVVIKGDVNGDGVISFEDAYIIRQYVNGDKTLENEYYIAGDVNESGSTNLLDVGQIEDYVNGEIDEFIKYIDPDLNRYEGPFTVSYFLTGMGTPYNKDYPWRFSPSDCRLNFKDTITDQMTSKNMIQLCTQHYNFAVNNDYPALPLMQYTNIDVDSCMDHDKEHIFKDFEITAINLAGLSYLGIKGDSIVRACPRCGFVDKIYSPSTNEVYWTDDMRVKTVEDCIRPGTFLISPDQFYTNGYRMTISLNVEPKPIYPGSLHLPDYLNYPHAYSTLRYNVNTANGYTIYPSAENRTILTQTGFDLTKTHNGYKGRVYYDKNICKGEHSYIKLYHVTNNINSTNYLLSIYNTDRIAIDYCWKCGHINKLYNIDTNEIYWESNGDDEWYALKSTYKDRSAIDGKVIPLTSSIGYSANRGYLITEPFFIRKLAQNQSINWDGNLLAFCLQNASLRFGLYKGQSSSNYSRYQMTGDPNYYNMVCMYYDSNISKNIKNCNGNHKHCIILHNHKIHLPKYNNNTESVYVDICPDCYKIHKVYSKDSDKIFWDSEDPKTYIGDVNLDGLVNEDDQDKNNKLLEGSVKPENQLVSLNIADPLVIEEPVINAISFTQGGGGVNITVDGMYSSGHFYTIGWEDVDPAHDTFSRSSITFRYGSGAYNNEYGANKDHPNVCDNGHSYRDIFYNFDGDDFGKITGLNICTKCGRISEFYR